MAEENVLKLDLTPVNARRILNDLVISHSERVFLTNHAKERMLERKFNIRQVHCCLKNGTFIEEPYRTEKGNWKMALEVRAAGDTIRTAVALDYDDGNFALIVTVY